MASSPSINSNSSGSQAPNPPPRTLSRPNQPPPPPPLPTVPPVPPTRDSSITISKATINRHLPSTIGAQSNSDMSAIMVNNPGEQDFVSQFQHLFKPLDDLPPPDPFMDKPKSYPSQRAQQKQQQQQILPTSNRMQAY